MWIHQPLNSHFSPESSPSQLSFPSHSLRSFPELYVEQSDSFMKSFAAVGALFANADASVMEFISCFVGPRHRARLFITTLSFLGFLTLGWLITLVLPRTKDACHKLQRTVRMERKEELNQHLAKTHPLRCYVYR